GEAGAFNRTPHGVVLAWFEDVLQILTPRNIGYALWNFRGPFGILDSDRHDVEYEEWYGHELDRDYLSLLQRY
ncbi:MAG: endoglucanase, partial [Spirochaetota bacterium]